MMQVETVTQQYNNNLAQFTSNPIVQWVDSIKGVTINKIDLPTAAAISTRIKPSAQFYQLPLSFAWGHLAEEGCFDPNCVNENKGPGESNPTGDPRYFDLGCGQFKQIYLIGYVPGVTDLASANAFSFNVNTAIPYFCSQLAGKVAWAQKVIAANTSSAPDPRFLNPYMLAAGAYNLGPTGMLEVFESGTSSDDYAKALSHCKHVFDLTTYFEREMGYQSMFSPDFAALMEATP